MLWHGIKDEDGVWEFAPVASFSPHQVVVELVRMGWIEEYAVEEAYVHALYLELVTVLPVTACPCAFCSPAGH